MSKRITLKMLKEVTLPEREVVSFSGAIDTKNQLLTIKFALRNGHTEILMLPAVIAAHILDSIIQTIERGRHEDMRPIAEFLKLQPEFEETDMDAKAGGQNHIATGAVVRSEHDFMYIAALIDPKNEVYKALYLKVPTAFYLRDMIQNCFRDGHLHFLPDQPTDDNIH